MEAINFWYWKRSLKATAVVINGAVVTAGAVNYCSHRDLIMYLCAGNAAAKVASKVSLQNLYNIPLYDPEMYKITCPGHKVTQQFAHRLHLWDGIYYWVNGSAPGQVHPEEKEVH